MRHPSIISRSSQRRSRKRNGVPWTGCNTLLGFFNAATVCNQFRASDLAVVAIEALDALASMILLHLTPRWALRTSECEIHDMFANNRFRLDAKSWRYEHPASAHAFTFFSKHHPSQLTHYAETVFVVPMPCSPLTLASCCLSSSTSALGRLLGFRHSYYVALSTSSYRMSSSVSAALKILSTTLTIG
jgi:hypothetical protein